MPHMDHDDPELRARVRAELLYPTRRPEMVAETTLTFDEFRAALEAHRRQGADRKSVV